MTIAILSWRAQETLINTLESYKKYGLDTLDDDKVILFQEGGLEDVRLAKNYGYRAITNNSNTGIAEGYKSLVDAATGDLFLFLENDWELIEDPAPVFYDAAERLRNNVYDVARLRHTDNPGNPLWSRQYAGHEWDGPEFMLDAVFWNKTPERIGLIEKDDDWYKITSPFANWTNNPTMFRTDWLRENIYSRMTGDVERDIQHWWEHQKFIVAHHKTGLFTHNRIDR